ncbi:MAG: hypothetical protein ABSC07_19380, partial [Terriglobales bacterium]
NAGAGTSGQVLTSNGAGALPTFQAAGGGSWQAISSVSASSSASISFTGLSNTYIAYAVLLTNIIPASSSTSMLLRTSANNGSSYDSGAGNYSWYTVGINGGDYYNNSSLSDTSITLFFSYGASGYMSTSVGANGWIYIFNPSAASYCFIRGVLSYVYTGTPYVNPIDGSGYRTAAAAVNAVQFFMGTGNIASGTFTLYGLVA